MSKVISDIFHMYDIRGIYGKELTGDLANLIGRAAGTYYLQHSIKKIVVGRDNRPSGANLKKKFIEGLTSTGCDVIDIGIVTTPMVYFSWYAFGAFGAVSITASHNPAEYNGIKLTMNKQGLYGDQYQEIKKIIEENRFTTSESKGKVSTKDIWTEYKNKLLSDIKIGRKLKVVVDTGNGTCSLFAPELVKSFPGLEVIELFTKSDGTFPNHEAYPQKTEYYSKMIETIKREKADFGIAYDGDGDRVGIYDENGKFVQNDILGAIYARQILKNYPNRSIVMNVSASQAVAEDVEKHKGKLVLWKTGYPFIVAKMKETNAILGAEISGHFFFKDRYFGYDDGMYASLRFIELVAAGNKTVSQIVSDLPAYYASNEFRVPVPSSENKFEIIEKIKQEIKKKYADVEILDFDGVRFTLANKSWGLIRASNTEALLSGRAEGRNKDDLRKVQTFIQSELAKFGIRLEMSFANE